MQSQMIKPMTISRRSQALSWMEKPVVEPLTKKPEPDDEPRIPSLPVNAADWASAEMALN